MPIDWAAISSSRTAANARPIRERASRWKRRYATKTAMESITKNAYFLYGLMTKPKIVIIGIFWIPIGPLVNESQLFSTLRTISPKPSVAMAR